MGWGWVAVKLGGGKVRFSGEEIFARSLDVGLLFAFDSGSWQLGTGG